MVDVLIDVRASGKLRLYDITDTWDDLVGAIDEIAPTTVEGVNQRVTDLATIVEEETTNMYERIGKDGLVRQLGTIHWMASDYANVPACYALRTNGSGASALVSEFTVSNHSRQE
ncbi:hypothetical protein Tco_0483961 [Tanacetum coccineum]